jgi:uracil-DNA glycosylase family 4
MRTAETLPLRGPEPGRDCPLCPRLVAFRAENRAAHADWHNAPVPSFGGSDARLLVVGLAPGRRGANRTGRPFTGDFAGQLLYPTLLAAGFAAGEYAQSADDGLRLIDCRITHAVRCVPPANKPTPLEAATCRAFLIAEIAAMPRLRAIMALGAIAHGATLAAFGLKAAQHPFGHGARHALPRGLLLVDSYHCSRQNTNTGRLTPEMFRSVVFGLREVLGAAAE